MAKLSLEREETLWIDPSVAPVIPFEQNVENGAVVKHTSYRLPSIEAANEQIRFELYAMIPRRRRGRRFPFQSEYEYVERRLVIHPAKSTSIDPEDAHQYMLSGDDPEAHAYEAPYTVV